MLTSAEALARIMKNEMETTLVYWGNIGMMENTMETITYIGSILKAFLPLEESSRLQEQRGKSGMILSQDF